MANRKISDLTALTTPASGDYLPIVDISEAAAASKNKRITIEELMRGMPDGTAAAPSIAFESDPNTGIYSPGADQLAISTNGTQRLTVDTAATTSTLPVVHPLGAVGTPSITFTSDLNTGFWSPTADTLAASTAGSERLRITSAGLLGLGTSSPQDLFHVEGATSPTIRLRNSTTGSNASPASTFIDFRGFNQEIRARIEVQDRRASVTGGFLNIGTADSTTTIVNALHIDSSQRVGIGTTSPSSLLHLADAGNITVGTTTGTKIGTATTQKLGFYNATPVVQPTAVANATDAATVITQLNALLAKLRTLGIIAT